MKKVTLTVAITLLIISPCIAHDSETEQPKNTRTIKLENEILSMIDGKQLGINGENVVLTKKYQTNILDILLGVKTKTEQRQGNYEFEGKCYSAQELRIIEENLGSQATQEQHNQLQAALNAMRNDFEDISKGFRDQAKASKPFIADLISESCQKRNRGKDSLILIWAYSKENEYALFNRHVKSIKDFEIFMTDLYNFLGDLVASCPIAQQQFKERVQKFGKIRQILATFSLTPQQQERFLKYIQEKLTSLTLNDITPGKIKELYTASQ